MAKMHKPLADSWAFEVLNHIASREAFETNHIELKSQLIPPKDFARQLAGLANAARWHPVLVLLGVNRRTFPGVPIFDIGDWSASLGAEFEYGHAPHLGYSNFIQFRDATICVLVFETDNPPYVVGSGKKGGPRDIPWRFGSATGPAGRAELLQLLAQKIGEPEIEIFKVELKTDAVNNMSVRAELFFYPAPNSEVVVPFHRIEISASEPNGDPITFPLSVSLSPVNVNSSLAKLTDSAVVIPSPSRLQLVAFSEEGQQLRAAAPLVDVSVSMHPAHFDHPIRFARQVGRREHSDRQADWQYQSGLARSARLSATDFIRGNLTPRRIPRSTI